MTDLRVEFMALSELLKHRHPDNPKDHDLGALDAAFDTFGFKNFPAIDERSGYLPYGHGRTDALAWRKQQGRKPPPKPVYAQDGEWFVPVIRGLEFEDEHQLEAYLVADNQLTMLGGWDEPQLAGLLQELASIDASLVNATGFDNEALEEMLQQLNAPTVEPVPADEMATVDYVPDAVFASDNDYEIPLLDSNLQARSLDLPFAIWGAQSRQTKIPGGTYAFYTSDDRFQALWADPSGVVNSGAANIVEPNFSCYATMPIAVGAYQIYRKRWIARWCQTYGVRVLVDLNVAPKFRDINLMGVPTGWKAYCTRSSVDYVDELDEEFALACERAEDSHPLFVVYGGGKISQARCKERGWLWLADRETRKQPIVTEMSDGK